MFASVRIRKWFCLFFFMQDDLTGLRKKKRKSFGKGLKATTGGI